jgi:division protein CdvB (Snf7/Vps24/ESCRT-III family)|tara:strand:- start:3834 stop:4055 length:222 start_codon:yes stop_codon:yes gene_type:complete
MDKKKKDCPYEELGGRIETIDVNLKSFNERIELIKEIMDESCPDEAESDKAVQEALDSFFIDELLKQKPIGEA